MVLLVLGVPILVLLLALALQRLETTLLSPRDVDLRDVDLRDVDLSEGDRGTLHELPAPPGRPSPAPGDVRSAMSDLASPRGSSSRRTG